MERYSKEYIDKFVPGGKSDFCIEQLFKVMPASSMLDNYCSGFGHTMLMKDSNCNCYLGFYISNYIVNKQKDFVYWHPFDALLKQSNDVMLFGEPLEITVN